MLSTTDTRKGSYLNAKKEQSGRPEIICTTWRQETELHHYHRRQHDNTCMICRLVDTHFEVQQHTEYCLKVSPGSPTNGQVGEGNLGMSSITSANRPKIGKACLMLNAGLHTENMGESN